MQRPNANAAAFRARRYPLYAVAWKRLSKSGIGVLEGTCAASLKDPADLVCHRAEPPPLPSPGVPGEGNRRRTKGRNIRRCANRSVEPAQRGLELSVNWIHCAINVG